MLFSSVLVFAIPWTLSLKVALYVRFPRQRCGNGLPFSFPGDLPDPRLNTSALADRFITAEPTEKAIMNGRSIKIKLLFIH